MSGNWVGFQSMPKKPAGLTNRRVSVAVESRAQVASVIELLTSAQGLSKWLGATQKCQPSVGAKFRSEIGGEDVESVYTAINLPKQVVILNDVLGEFDFELKQRGENVEVAARLSRATLDTDFDFWAQSANQILEKLASVIAHG